MTHPLVSIIVPVFNREYLLKKCVESVSSQTYRPIELVLIDDGSSDGSFELMGTLAGEYGGTDGITIVLQRQENAGAPDARNRGVELASGEWIQFLDSDDTLLPHKLEEAVKAAQATGAEIVYSKAQFVDEQGNRLPRFWGRELTGDWRDYFEFSWQTMCAIYSRDVLQRIGPWNVNLVISQNWQLCIRAVISGAKIHFIDRVDALYRSEGNDRIGSNLSLVKHRGRATALWSVFEHLKYQGRITPELRHRFQTRFLHIPFSCRAINARGDSLDLIRRMTAAGLLSPAVALVLRKTPGPVASRWLLRLFERKSRS